MSIQETDHSPSTDHKYGGSKEGILHHYDIGNEFWGGAQPPQTSAVDKPAAAEVFDTPEIPIESKARDMFGKADVQNRLSTLERAVDSLGHTLKPELVEIREELSFLRLMIDDLLHEVRQQNAQSPGSSKKKSA